MIVGVCGLSSSGKDAVSDLLVSGHGAVKVALADEIKRAAARFFDFTPEQLWGPSEKRNAPDKRYPREHEAVDVWNGAMWRWRCRCCGASRPEGEVLWERPCFLTPRYALQLLGTEYGRHCYSDVWVERVVRDARWILQKPTIRAYVQQIGAVEDAQFIEVEDGVSHQHSHPPVQAVVVPDVRFKNEILGLKKAGAKLVRVKRVGYEKPRFDHPSETEQMGISDPEFDYVIENNSTLEALGQKVHEMRKELSK